MQFLRDADKRTKTAGSVRVLPLALLLFFAVLLAIGITLGEPVRVLEQARSICQACMGIG